MSPPDSTEAASSGPLSDIRVIDIGHVLAGPFAATLLGDLGADVIKVENPRGGDTLRTLSPKADGVPVWWKVAGRNKRCVALDLKVEEAKEILLRLIDGADVLVENFRAGTLERMGFEPELLMGPQSGTDNPANLRVRPGPSRYRAARVRPDRRGDERDREPDGRGRWAATSCGVLSR